MKVRELFRLVKSDIVRYAEHNKQQLTFFKSISIFFMPSVQSICLYRLSHFFWVHNLRFVGRLFYTLNLIIYGADISPIAQIGAYFYMPHTVAIVLIGKIGEYCTVYAQGACGGGLKGREIDIGAGPGFAMIGDHVTIGARSVILGPCRIGSGSIIGPCSLVTKDVPENSLAIGNPVRIRSLNQDTNDKTSEE